MSQVSRENIIARLGDTNDFTQGQSSSFTIDFFQDINTNPLNLYTVDYISISIIDHQGAKQVQYSSPQQFGVTDLLTKGTNSNNNKATFTITPFQSTYMTPGDLYAEITLRWDDYYPQAKTIIMPDLLLGYLTSITTAPTQPDSNVGAFQPTFQIEWVDGQNPTADGKGSVDAIQPENVTQLKLRNLDEHGVRFTALENFLLNRINKEGSLGIITFVNQENSNLYTIYKIDSWQRVDMTEGDTNERDNDGIQINLIYESKSAGSGINPSALDFEIGQEYTFVLDSYSAAIANEEGILYLDDKNLAPSLATSGNYSSTGIQISKTPYMDSYILVEVNGISVSVANGDRDAGVVYFSNDGGLTARLIKDIEDGDTLYWNGEIIGYELDANDKINLVYEVSNGMQLLSPNEISQGEDYTQSHNPFVTSGDGSPTGITLDYNPFEDGSVSVSVNGIDVTESWGNKTGVVYFSNDGGLTAKGIPGIQQDDELYWNGIIAGYELGPEDVIELNYQKDSLEL